MNRTLSTESTESILKRLNSANQKLDNHYPGDTGDFQPVQTLYGGAQLFKSNTTEKIGTLAEKSFAQFAPDAGTLAKALTLPGDSKLWEKIHQRVGSRLKSCAVEDFRIDFEDGYGIRPDKEEDETATTAAIELAKGMKEGTLPPFIGIRIKPFNSELTQRSIRTLDIFVTKLVEENKNSNQKLPDNFAITLPKVSIPEQVTAFEEVLEILEKKLTLPSKSLKFEIMIETPQAIIGSDGKITVSKLVDASKGRCFSVHFGTYDYTAGNDISASQQIMGHPSCAFALQMMKVSLAGTGIWLSDGATSIMPVPLHRGDDLSAEQNQENMAAVHNAWKISYDNVMSSLERGLYQGWDLHPGQLPIRYAALYSFFLEGLDQATIRLRNFIEKAAQATLVGDVFDDAATGQGLLNYFLRALGSGAISEEEVEQTGLTLDEIKSRSFLSILEGRKLIN